MSGRTLTAALGIEHGGGVICAVGAGGKKTALYRLARELPGRVALTATVHTPPFARHVDAVLVEDDPLARLTGGAPAARVLGIAHPSEKHNRWAGLAPDAVDRLAARGMFDTVLVKADGARFRWIKAPAPDEPVIPSSATLVLVLVSARAIGRPLDAEVAHHPEALARLTGARLGEPIRPEHVAALLAHPEGGLKGVGDARVVPILNAVDDDETRERALAAARAALAATDRFERVLLTALTADAPVIAIVSR
ncbi:MAG: selenium cofactor biosynthesis protein YqeC [Gemmatimonadota bacterium]